MATKSSKKNASEKKAQRKIQAENSVATPPSEVVTSSQMPQQAAQMAEGIPPEAKEQNMTLTFKSLDKRGRNAIFTGAAVALRFPIGAFPDKTAPATLDVSGLAEKVAKTPRAQMTPGERKAARAAQPKLTLAEKVAKTEARLAAQRAKLAAAQPAEQPSL